jgi:mannose-6-phosphate isomerase-like protein (cupin superfamily)
MAAQPKKKSIDSVAAELLATRSQKRGMALVLGAGCSRSSNVPLWEEFAQSVCDQLGVPDKPRGKSAIERLERYVVASPMNQDLVTGCVDKTIAAARASVGYKYIARLVEQGFYATIVTTNWDWLLEDALYRVMRANRLLVLTRDGASDEELARQIQAAGNRTVVVKLHGDPKTRLRIGEGLSTRALSKPLLDALTPRLSKVHVVGYSGNDTDVLQLLYNGVANAEILVVARKTQAIQKQLRMLATGICGDEETLSALRYRPQVRGTVDAPQADERINVGDFDNFFCQMTLSIERRLVKETERATRLRDVEAQLLKKEESGLSYINYNQITRMARAFVNEVTRERTPDIVFFVNDPSAPGGMELKKRIEADLVAAGVKEIGILLIHGETNNRSFKREFRGKRIPAGHGGKAAKVRVVHILDSITFSGNTLQIARKQVREWYPKAEVRLGALLVSQLLVDRQSARPTDEHIYYESITDRFEIFFPWGVTQATADFDRKFSGVDGDRLVSIARRPWGAVEILADEEICSVRLLTIEANRRLSFQRHLCRDELFVALDDNIGIDVCGAELRTGVDPFDPAVKSMILEKGDYILVSRGIWHRTKASMDRVRLLEVGFGLYDQQYDIERLFDDFERVDADGAK